MTVREWLPKNGYGETADLITEVLADLKASGSKERRSWGLILSGGKNGKPAVVAGREFPVLASAQEAYKKPITANAINNNVNEEFPKPRVTGRWPKKRRLPRTAKRLAKKTSRPQHARAS
jgi:hypothetical protein